MTQKHKNAEYIIAFANGEEVEWAYSCGCMPEDQWFPVREMSRFDGDQIIFRMKPKTITTKGYKRYAWQQNNLEWVIGIVQEGGRDDYPHWNLIDKEWQYHVIEEKV